MVLSFVLLGMTLSTIMVSCRGDEISMIETEIEMEDGTDFMELSRVAKEYKVRITTEDNAVWKASIDDILGYVALEDTVGTGSKTITFYTSTNRYDEDRTANLCITFPGYEKSNKTIPLKQMGKNNDPENADLLGKGNEIYAVGYGYDTRDRWAHPNSVKAEMLRTSELIKSNYISAGAIDLTYDADIITGSSASELSIKLNASANVSGGGWGFKGEAGASFDMNDFKSNKYEYAIAYINMTKRNVTTTKSAGELRTKYMTPEAYKEINGLNVSGERKDSACAYPSTESGFDKLLNAYGTHLVIKAQLGGRIKYAMRVDVSEIKNSYDLKAYAKLSYGGVVKADASVSADMQKSYQSNSSHIHTTISILGGSDRAVTGILNASEPGAISTSFTEWKSSLMEMDNLALMDFSASDAMIPLYEMVDKEKYPDRYNALKEYMKTGRLKYIESINMEYESGTTTMIEGIPAFDGSSEKNTLIKDVYNQGQWVGRICNEFVPVINKKRRVTVVYPVLSNKVKYNMGYFVGDEGHCPAKVSWQGNNLIVTDCPDDSIGARMTLYLKGANVSAKCYTTPINGTVEDATISAPGNEGQYNYPLVKIFNNIWTREDHQSQRKNDGNPIDADAMYYSNATEKLYYRASVAADPNFPPSGWKVPASSDYEGIKATLTSNEISPTGHAFLKNGVLGYDAEFEGWIDKGYDEHVRGGDEQTEYLTSDKYHVRIRTDGGFAVESGVHETNWFMSVRLIQK